MVEISILQHLVPVFTTIESCIESGVQLPTLILVYSTIDALGWLCDDAPTPSVRKSFQSWADRYVVPNMEHPCTGLELYSARCGVLHTFTADSELSTKGNVRKVQYAWGTADVTRFRDLLHQSGNTDSVAIHVADLARALRLGTADMLDAAEQDTSMSVRLNSRGSKYFLAFSPEFAPVRIEPGFARDVT